MNMKSSTSRLHNLITKGGHTTTDVTPLNSQPQNTDMVNYISVNSMLNIRLLKYLHVLLKKIIFYKSYSNNFSLKTNYMLYKSSHES